MENRNTIIAICCAFMFLCTLFACSKGCNKSNGSKSTNISTQSTYGNRQKKSSEDEYSKTSSSYSAPSRNYSMAVTYGNEDDDNPPPVMSEAQRKKLEQRFKKDDEELAELAKEWMESQLKDPNLSAKSLEQYKLKSNQSFNNGMLAYKKGDFKNAIKYFNELAQDEKASPISRYYALSSILDCARAIHDVELFFIASRMRATLVAKEDLSIIGLAKNTATLDWVEKVENTLKARTDKDAFEKCIKLKFENPLIKKRETAIRAVERDIAFYTEKYKELLNE